MRRVTTIVKFVVPAVLVCLLSAPVFAAAYSGTVRSVYANSKRLSIRLSSTRRKFGSKNRTFRVPATTKITLDGKTVSLAKLKPGYRVSILTNRSGDLLKVLARSSVTSTRSKPKTTPSPKSPAPPVTKSPRPSITSPTSKTPASQPNRQPIVSAIAGTNIGNGGSWPTFRGLKRDNLATDTGLSSDWTKNAPRSVWSARGLGDGYSSVAVAAGMVVTMGIQGGREVVVALNLSDGRVRWTAQTRGGVYKNGQGSGPRGTPTIDGNRVYALGGNGDLVSIDAANGNVIWSKNILREFGANNISWGISESVLIDGNRLICTPGGRSGTMVALDKQTGRTIWQATAPGNPSAGYASAIVAIAGGVKQYINFTSRGVIGVRAEDGTFMWNDGSSANGTANCSSPLFFNNHVFSASGYGKGGSLLRLTSSGGRTRVERAYHTNDMKNHHGGMVIVNGYLYGVNDPGILTCMELKSGRVAWRDRSVGKGAITYADGHIYLRSERGPVALVEANPNRYREKGRFNQPDRSSRKAWSHPVVADGKLFLRDQDLLLAYRLK